MTKINEDGSDALLSDFLRDSELGKIVYKNCDLFLLCSCGYTFQLDHPQGRIHDGGLDDGQSVRWWLSYECPKCKYCWSWRKVARRLFKKVKE